MHPPPRFRTRPTLPGLVLGVLLLLSAPAPGFTGLRPPVPAVELELIDREHGHALPRYSHGGRQWLAGLPGQAYAVRLRNTTGRRLLVVLSVDGINAVNGRTAAPDQSGYVLDPWQQLEVAGWRKSLREVARFEFTDPAASYASRSGRPANIGVIGIAVFGERVASMAPPAAGIASQSTPADAQAAEAGLAMARPAPALPAAVPQQLGTGHGAREQALARHTRFERQGPPLQVTELRYDTPWALAGRGIRVRDRSALDGQPRAFPDYGFVPDPPGY